MFNSLGKFINTKTYQLTGLIFEIPAHSGLPSNDTLRIATFESMFTIMWRASLSKPHRQKLRSIVVSKDLGQWCIQSLKRLTKPII